MNLTEYWHIIHVSILRNINQNNEILWLNGMEKKDSDFTISELGILKTIKIDSKIKLHASNPETRRYFRQIFTGMGGRFTRLKIISLISKKPINAHKIAHELQYDYTTIQYNIKVLEEHNLIKKDEERYGEPYHVTHFLQENILSLEDVIKKVVEKIHSKKKYIS